MLQPLSAARKARYFALVSKSSTLEADGTDALRQAKRSDAVTPYMANGHCLTGSIATLIVYAPIDAHYQEVEWHPLPLKYRRTRTSEDLNTVLMAFVPASGTAFSMLVHLAQPPTPAGAFTWMARSELKNMLELDPREALA